MNRVSAVDAIAFSLLLAGAGYGQWLVIRVPLWRLLSAYGPAERTVTANLGNTYSGFHPARDDCEVFCRSAATPELSFLSNQSHWIIQRHFIVGPARYCGIQATIQGRTTRSNMCPIPRGGLTMVLDPTITDRLVVSCEASSLR